MEVPKLQLLGRIAETERTQRRRDIARGEVIVTIDGEYRPVKLITAFFRDEIDENSRLPHFRGLGAGRIAVLLIHLIAEAAASHAEARSRADEIHYANAIHLRQRIARASIRNRAEGSRASSRDLGGQI